MNSVTTDILLERMFLARRVGLWAGAALIGLSAAIWLNERLDLFTARGELLLLFAPLGAMVALIAAASLATCYYVFRAGLRESGLRYAVGHSLLCAAISSIALLGIILVPLQVRSDIQRWRAEGELPAA